MCVGDGEGGEARSRLLGGKPRGAKLFAGSKRPKSPPSSLRKGGGAMSTLLGGGPRGAKRFAGSTRPEGSPPPLRKEGKV